MIHFPDYVQKMCQEDEDNNCKLLYEYRVSIHCHYNMNSYNIYSSFFIFMQELQNVPKFSCDVARLSQNTKHNRFKNVYPCEDDRSK